MSVLRRSSQILPTVAGLLAATSTIAAADQPLFTWIGTVDREVMVVMRGRNVSTQGVDARLPNSARVSGQIPRGAGYGDVRVRLESGRGQVDVIEQPSARNGYQTVVRVRDPQNGADRYRLVAYWTGDDGSRGNGGYGTNGRYPDNGGYGNGRDERRNDDRRDDDRRGNDRRDDDRGYGNGRDDRRDDDRVCNNGNGRGNGNGRAKKGKDCRNDRRDRRDRDDRDDRDDRNNGDWDRNDRNNGGYGNGSYGPGTLQWSGRVDDVAEITIQGRRVEYRTVRGASVSDVRQNVSGGGLRDANVQITGGSGRGLVQVVQQPSADNNYTAVIRITDIRAGVGSYDFQARW